MGHASGTPTARSSLHTSSRGENSIRVNSPPHSTQEIIPKDAPANVSDPPASQAPKPFKPDGRFWFILVSIAVMTFCGTVESTIIINALPTIVADLGGGPAYIWVPNAFFLASVAVLPLYAQMSNIFGRRHLLLIAVALFILGSGLCGGSSSMGMLIASRAIQGLGGGGIDMLAETIIMDMVPLRERSKYLSVVLIGGVLGASLGPFLGGVIVVSLGWRWIFYINVFLAGASFVMFFIFLRVKHRRDQTFAAQLKRIDFAGNGIFMASIIAVLLAMTWAGPVYQWSNFRIIVPLILGFLGLFAFTAFEWTAALEPSFPRIIVSNRTSAAALMMVFLSNLCLMWTFYFLPIYFQAVLAKSPLGSGIAIVPISACVVPFAMIGGTLLSKWGRYKPLHTFAWAFLILGIGLFSLLDRNSTTAAWACFEIISSVGSGILSVTLLPAIQAPLDEKFVATATGVYGFARGFGSIWGVTIPSAIFNNEVRRHKDLISDVAISNKLANGQAYELATKAFLDTLAGLDTVVRDQVIEVFTRAIQTVWYVGIAFAGAGFLVSFVQKEIKLRQELNTEFGLEDTNTVGSGDGEGRASGNDAIELDALSTVRREH